MVRASVASERARRGHKRASTLGERAVPKNYPSERLNIINKAYLLSRWLATITNQTRKTIGGTTVKSTTTEGFLLGRSPPSTIISG